MFCGNVVGLGVVVAHVEELPSSVAQGCHLPVAYAYGPSFLVFPEHGSFFLPCVAVDEWQEALSFCWQGLYVVSVVGFGVGGVGELEACGHDVDVVAWLSDDASVLCFESCRPLYDGGCCCSAVE